MPLNGAGARAKTFQEGTLWPEFLALSAEFDAHLQELTDRAIREAIAEAVNEPAEAEALIASSS